MGRKKSQLENYLWNCIFITMVVLVLFVLLVVICIPYPVVGFGILIAAITVGLLRWKRPKRAQDSSLRTLIEYYDETGDPEARNLLLAMGASRQTIEEIDNRHLSRFKKLDQLTAMSSREFEQFVAKLFERMGYSVAVTQASADEGVDIFLERHGRRAIVQCKKYEGSVGQPTVRDFYGAMIHNRVDQGFLVTTGTFSLPAQTWAAGKQIHLVDGAELVDWLESLLDSKSETEL